MKHTAVELKGKTLRANFYVNEGDTEVHMVLSTVQGKVSCEDVLEATGRREILAALQTLQDELFEIRVALNHEAIKDMFDSTEGEDTKEDNF